MNKYWNLITIVFIVSILLYGCSNTEKEYYKNGTLKATYKINNGVRDGVFILYDSTGNIIQEGLYSKGKLNGTILSYYANGHIMTKTSFKNGLRNGKYNEYDSLGNLLFQVEFKNDLQDGLFQEFFPGNHIKKKAEFIKGDNTGGLWTYYHNGCIKSYSLMNQDTTIYEENYDSLGRLLNIDRKIFNLSVSKENHGLLLISFCISGPKSNLMITSFQVKKDNNQSPIGIEIQQDQCYMIKASPKENKSILLIFGDSRSNSIKEYYNIPLN